MGPPRASQRHVPRPPAHCCPGHCRLSHFHPASRCRVAAGRTWCIFRCCRDEWQGCLLRVCSLWSAPPPLWRLQELPECVDYRSSLTSRLPVCRPHTTGQSMPLLHMPLPDGGQLLWQQKTLRDSAHLDHDAPCIFGHLPAGICCSKDVLLRVLGNALSHVTHRRRGSCSREGLGCVRRKQPGSTTRILLDNLMACADGMPLHSCQSLVVHSQHSRLGVEAGPGVASADAVCASCTEIGIKAALQSVGHRRRGPLPRLLLTKPASLWRRECHVGCLKSQQTCSHQSSVAVEFLVQVLPAWLLFNMRHNEGLVQLRKAQNTYERVINFFSLRNGRPQLGTIPGVIANKLSDQDERCKGRVCYCCWATSCQPWWHSSRGRQGICGSSNS